MKIEVEISDEQIKNHIEEYARQNLTSRFGPSVNLKTFLDEQVKIALKKSLVESDFMQIIEDNCRELAIREIDKAAAQKTPGWVRQQMKEMLKYARAEFWKSTADSQ